MEEMVDRFSEDEPGYERWLRSHPSGYVLNCDQQPRASYLVAHRAECHTISGQPSRGSTWTCTYQKVCAGSIKELDDWARSKTGSVPSRCGTCQP